MRATPTRIARSGRAELVGDEDSSSPEAANGWGRSGTALLSVPS